MIVRGADFTSTPSRHKPITCVECLLENGRLAPRNIEMIENFEEFEPLLARTGKWILGLDFPFGQSRKFIENIAWPNSWPEYVGLVASMTREEFCKVLCHYKDSREFGDKEHLRKTDEIARSKSPQKLYGVPVGKMFFEGAKRLLDSPANVLPVRPTRYPGIAVEAYPKLVAHRLIGRRSYKSDDKKKKQDQQREKARIDIVKALRTKEIRRVFGFDLDLSRNYEERFINDPTGDQLDALLCALQATWSFTQKRKSYGIPPCVDLLEGWIVDPSLGVGGGR